MHPDLEEILISEEKIQNRIKELAEELRKEYSEKNPLCVCILKGAVPFMADLTRAMDFPLQMDYMAVSSYGNSAETSGVVRILKDLDTPVEGRDVLIVEDIVDSGLTLSHLITLMKTRKAKSVKTVTLLDKPDRRQIELSPDYCGFVIPNKYIVGYGTDFAERYRNLPYIGVLKEEFYRS
jgi:hypoxanthine phosphoribosyltransferase